MILVLGAGLSGLSASYHLGHDKCQLLEKQHRPFGHIGSEQRDGFTWDQGPHVSFTKHDYVRRLFEEGVDGRFDEIEVKVSNYFRGHWIDHPAQTSLHQVPEPVRGECLASFLSTRANSTTSGTAIADNYQQWLDLAFGPVFASTFPSVYTRKYWTRDASELATGWIGDRILYPNVEDVREGSQRALNRSMHYITKVRYPQSGGYQSFAARLAQGSRIRYGADVASIDLSERSVWLGDGERIDYSRLVNTLPLPQFINACRNVPARVREAARALSCTQLLLVNVAAPHTTRRPEHWIYVYDEDMLATRINCTERLAASNAPAGWTGVQAEVYFSRHRPLPLAPQAVGARVEDELIEMGLIDPALFPASQATHRHIVHAPWANVIFDRDTAPALDMIWSWLEGHGLRREPDDVSPLTKWDDALPLGNGEATLSMAGRFGQWKYFWTDDCVLRGRQLAQRR